MLRHYTLSEIDALCKKAAKGSNYSWGEAEEVGKASRWLSMYGVCGAEIVLNLLRLPKAQMHNPITLGCYIHDTQYDWIQHKHYDKHCVDIAYPVFLLPFISSIARIQNQTIRYNWVAEHSTGQCLLSANSVMLDEHITDVVCAKEITIHACTSEVDYIKPQLDGCDVSLKVWNQLEKLALKTLLPISEQSRRNAG